ncbi:glycosyltransferase family protein [Halomonas sp. 328]|uniref:glycosyltransferase family protein n=1 Tax=Halomonas sp. 328 TaxID=2776704 RepID=UPI0018A6EA1D|nr:glycosyltransferase [Halomonas sp. 328]MBF8223891.1 glycosyltransferase [Halomonas sp. 328]
MALNASVPRWLVLSDGARPTEDIYFLESAAPLLRARGVHCGRLEARGWRGLLGRGIAGRLVGVNILVCRTLPEAWLSWLERRRDQLGRIVYLIDDDLVAAAEDATLPEAYRQRMARAASAQPRMLAVADEVVASSPALAARFEARHPRVRVLTPPLIAELPPLGHFAAPPSAESPWRIGFHGTRAHLADLMQIAPALVALQRERDDTTLELMLGRHTPAVLAELPRTATPEPLAWPAFRDYQTSRWLHIGLVPLWETPFNRGKSYIKFLDIAAMGGVGLFSRRAPYTELVEHGVNGLLVGDEPSHWRHSLDWLLAHPGEARQMAEAAAQTARCLGDPETVANFWAR